MTELGSELTELLDHVALLRELRLVAFDECTGYETTATGEAWLAAFDDR